MAADLPFLFLEDFFFSDPLISFSTPESLSTTLFHNLPKFSSRGSPPPTMQLPLLMKLSINSCSAQSANTVDLVPVVSSFGVSETLNHVHQSLSRINYLNPTQARTKKYVNLVMVNVIVMLWVILLCTSHRHQSVGHKALKPSQF